MAKSDPEEKGEADTLSPLRVSVGKAIADLRGFSGTAASPEMRAVMCALDWLGMAYGALRPQMENPAYEDE